MWGAIKWRSGLLAGWVGIVGLSVPVHAEVGRVIVKYRADSRVQAQASDAARRAVMSAETGLAIQENRVLGGRLHVLKVDGFSSSELVKRLSQQADVEYAVPDVRRHALAVPNDALFGAQWYLQAYEASAIRAVTAWDTTTGDSSLVVAVLDTGILGDHPDLANKLTASGGVLYGYDFVSDAAIGNDGDGRDSDPSDPGDWVTTAEATTEGGIFKDCPVGNSSWHGSFVAGIIAASSNNTSGVAGVAWGAKILPVRVLGKCGGYDSDILAGMLWAAGLPVSGVSDNLYPAKIINMSLGGPDSCNAAYADAIAQITARGALVVAAAGNDGGAVGIPANCAGALAVGGLRNDGAKVAYSSYGAVTGIAAPAGNIPISKVCSFPFYSTTNSGTQSPLANTYTSTADCEIGTSYATPLVAGVAALMRSLNPALTPAQLMARLKAGATAFPAVSGLPSCPETPPAAGTYVECNCTPTTCGAGMLSAPGALGEAQRPIAAISAASSATTCVAIPLSAAASVAASGHTLASYQWTASAGALANPATANATLTPSVPGDLTVTLLVTDDAGRTDTATTTITVSGDASACAGSASGGGGGGHKGFLGAIDPATVLLLLGLGGLAYAERWRSHRRVSRK